MTTPKYLIDTDVLIDYLRGFQQAEMFLIKLLDHSACCLSVITVAELYAGIREGKERALLERFLQIFQVISIDKRIAEMGGLYRRNYIKSNGMGLADALIAATAKCYEAQLVTLNKKHFPMVNNLVVPYGKK